MTVSSIIQKPIIWLSLVCILGKYQTLSTICKICIVVRTNLQREWKTWKEIEKTKAQVEKETILFLEV